jgi:hypothetical protein
MVTISGPVFVTEKSNSAIRSPGLAVYSFAIASNTRFVDAARPCGSRSIPASATSQKARKMAIESAEHSSAFATRGQTDFSSKKLSFGRLSPNLRKLIAWLWICGRTLCDRENKNEYQ